jgi:hypothetical protein
MLAGRSFYGVIVCAFVHGNQKKNNNNVKNIFLCKFSYNVFHKT